MSPSATATQPVNPRATTLQPAAPVAPVPVVPSRGNRAGIGGAFRPSGLSVGVGLTLSVGAAVAGGYLAARCLRRAG